MSVPINRRDFFRRGAIVLALGAIRTLPTSLMSGMSTSMGASAICIATDAGVYEAAPLAVAAIAAPLVATALDDADDAVGVFE